MSVSPAPASAVLREPAHQVSPRAVTYWRVSALIGAVVEWAIAIPVYVFAVPADLRGRGPPVVDDRRCWSWRSSPRWPTSW